MGAGAASSDSNGAKPILRDSRGYFLPGTRGGPGNPIQRMRAEFQAALNAATTPKQVAEVMATIYEKALDGEGWACKEFLDRTVGKAVPTTEHENAARSAFAVMWGEIVTELMARAPDARAAAEHVRIIQSVISEKAARPVEVEGSEG